VEKETVQGTVGDLRCPAPKKEEGVRQEGGPGSLRRRKDVLSGPYDNLLTNKGKPLCEKFF
jgi:hypothetical protein